MLQAAVRNATPALKHAAEHMEHVAQNAHASVSLSRAPARPTLRRAQASSAHNDVLAHIQDLEHSTRPRTPSYEMNFSTMIDVHGNPMSPGVLPNTPRLTGRSTLLNGFFSPAAEIQSPLNEIPHDAVSLEVLF